MFIQHKCSQVWYLAFKHPKHGQLSSSSLHCVPYLFDYNVCSSCHHHRHHHHHHQYIVDWFAISRTILPTRTFCRTDAAKLPYLPPIRLSVLIDVCCFFPLVVLFAFVSLLCLLLLLIINWCSNSSNIMQFNCQLLLALLLLVLPFHITASMADWITHYTNDNDEFSVNH